MGGSFVYVIRDERGLHKIGVSTNPTARLTQLRTAQLHLVNGLTPLEAGDRWIGKILPDHRKQSLEAGDVMVQSIEHGHREAFNQICNID